MIRKKVNNLYHYRYDTLSPRTKRNLPSEDYLKTIQKEFKHDSNSSKILASLRNAESKNVCLKLKHYRESANEKKSYQYAQTQVWIEQLINLNKKYSKKQLHEAIKDSPTPFKCTSYSKFTVKLKEAKEAIKNKALPEYIMHGSIENDYRNLIDDNTNGKAIIYWYGHRAGTNFDDVWYFYQREYKKLGYPRIKSVSTIANYLNNPRIKSLWFGIKHGKASESRNLEHKFSRERASFPDALWGGDGTRIDLEIQDVKGNWIPSLDIYWIFDSYSGYIVGYAIGRGEKSTLVMSAYKNAIRNTGYLPYQSYYDPGAANVSNEVKGMLKKITKLFFPHEAKRPEPLRTEGFTNQIQSQGMKFMENWTGGNVTSKNKSNPDTLKNLRKSGNMPTMEEFFTQVDTMVKDWNEKTWKKAQTRHNIYFNTPHEKRRLVEQTDIIELFMVKRPKPVKYTKHGLIMEVDGKKHFYTVKDSEGDFDYSFHRKYLDLALDVHYDHENLEWIALDFKGKRIGIATPKALHKEAIADFKKGDKQKLDKDISNRKNYMTNIGIEGEGIINSCESEGIVKMGYNEIYKDDLNDAQDSQKAKLNGVNDKAIQKTTSDSKYHFDKEFSNKL